MTSTAPPSYTSSVTHSRERKKEGSAKTSKSLEGKKSRHTSSRDSDSRRPLDVVDVDSSHLHRRSVYGPEFLEQFANNRGDGDSKFKVITGDQAADIYRSYMKDNEPGDSVSHDDTKLARKGSLPPVVFAFTTVDAGRKLVDYYLTWRGKTRTQHLTGSERKRGFLDAEFDKVTETLDREFRITNRNRRSPPPDTFVSSPLAAPPGENPTLQAPTRAATLPEAASHPLSERPRSFASSVLSLPFLGMIPGVPKGNRMPLVALNPDPPTSSTAESDNDSIKSVHSSPIEDVDNTSVAAVSSEGSIETKQEQSPSSRSSASLDSKPRSSSLPPIKTSSDSHSHQGRSHKSRKRREDSSESKSTSSKGSDEESVKEKKDDSGILIVLMDEKNKDAWHGDEKRLIPKRTPTPVLALGRGSPWMTPLVHTNSIKYRSRHQAPAANNSDTETDESASEEDDGPVIPVEGYFMNDRTMTHDPPEWHEAPVLPMQFPDSPNRSYPILQAGYHTPQSRTSTYPLPFPHVEYQSPYSSPYSSPYLLSSPQSLHSLHTPIPVSRHMSPVSHGSPYPYPLNRFSQF